MSKQKFPDLPDPTEIPRRRLSSTVTYWWIGTILLLGLTIVWLPSQCATSSFSEINMDNDSGENLAEANQNTELEYRKDDLWYKIGDDTPYNGYAIDFHENGKMKSRTSISEGKAVGLIEEWDENGSIRGVLFKDEFQE
tara:strand:- start:2992 stop:3408 length:417 start_codon:yes stop_codon:yes gene_type:complete